MHKIISFFTVLLFTQFTIVAQNQVTAPTFKKILTLNVITEGGANGGGVAWHPIQKKYYTGMAGNSTFPMCVFDAKGKKLSDESLETQTDIRGLWYNSLTKTIQTNGYDDFGWGEYKLDSKGIPTENVSLFKGMFQPNDGSVGTFDAANNWVYFLKDFESIDVYTAKDASYFKTIHLHVGLKDSNDVANDQDYFENNYNTTTVLFTGIRNQEFALLNVTEHSIEYYNTKGLMTKTKNLPEDITLNTYFNMAYANGFIWLFDKENRVWNGYK